jgi:hypothetical protein
MHLQRLILLIFRLHYGLVAVLEAMAMQKTVLATNIIGIIL